MIRIIFNQSQLPYQTEREIAYCGKLISGYYGVNRRNDPRNGIWNDPIDSVILSAYSSVYSKVEDYKTQNKTHSDIKRKWEEMVAASISVSSC